MNKSIVFVVIILSLVNGTRASQLGVGTPWTDIHFWRFWKLENRILDDKILIFNDKNEPVNISFMIAKIIDNGLTTSAETDSSFGIVGGPWQIPAHGYKIFLVPKISIPVDKIRNYLFKILCNGSEKEGLMTIYNAKPNGNFPLNRIITTSGVFGNGDGSDTYWLEHSSFFAKPGEKVNVRLIITPPGFDSLENHNKWFVRFPDPTESIKQKQGISLKLIEVDKGNLQMELKVEKPSYPNSRKNDYITILPADKNANYKQFYAIDFVFDTPKTISPHFCYFGIELYLGNIGGSFQLPLIVLPK